MNLVLDIGGTKTRIGFVSDTYRLLETSFLLTPKKYSDGLKNIFSHVKSRDVRAARACVGIAGVLSEGKLYYSPNLKGWIGKPIISDFRKEFGNDVVFENDAALAGLGEATYGAGKDYKNIGYLTIGTGVGGAKIVDKRIDNKVYGFEPGRMFFQNISKTKRNKYISFENLVSGKAIKRIYGATPETITDVLVWSKILKNIAVGVCNAVYLWNPEVIILGGGVTLSDNFDIVLLRKEVRKILKKTYPSTPQIKKSLLGDFSGIWGGIAFLKDLHN